MTLLLLGGQGGGRSDESNRREQEAADDAEGTEDHFEAVAGLSSGRPGERRMGSATNAISAAALPLATRDIALGHVRCSAL